MPKIPCSGPGFEIFHGLRDILATTIAANASDEGNPGWHESHQFDLIEAGLVTGCPTNPAIGGPDRCCRAAMLIVLEMYQVIFPKLTRRKVMCLAKLTRKKLRR